jgi:outer membrane protein OmpA-like peptidoglycan-associated protein
MLSACSSQYYRNKANDEYQKLGFSKAAYYYEKSLRRSENAHVRARLGDCYRLMNITDKAELAYQLSLRDSSLRNTVIIPYSKMLIENGRHRLASELLTNYLKTECKNDEACVLTACCERVKELVADSDLYRIREVNLPGLLNAFSPVEHNGGLIVSGEIPAGKNARMNPWTGNSYLNLYYTQIGSDGNWTYPATLPGLTSEFHEASPTFAANDSMIYFTRSNLTEGKLNKDSKNTNNLKVYFAHRSNNQWANIKEFPYNSDEYSTGHPCLSKDGTKLFFTSDKPGGFGGTDIYYAELNGSEWSEPKNAGELVNTSGNESFPYLAHNNELYFSSDGHPGMGGLDIFSAHFYENCFLDLKNLGAPLNSTKDDFGYSLRENQSSGYLSSARSGADKVYEFVKVEPLFMLTGQVVDKKTGEPIKGAKVNIFSRPDNIKQEFLTDDEGKYWVKLNKDIAYDLFSEGPEYYKSEFQFLTNINDKRSKTYEVNFELEKVEVEKPIVIPNIYYGLNKWDLNEPSKQGLEVLVQLMKENPSINIELSSHTDSRSSDKYNLTLSQKRAQSAVDFIISRGIKSERIIAKGYGESLLLNHCVNQANCSEEDHGVNRRTEFKIIKITASN